KEEATEINQIKTDMLNTAVDTMSKSEAEQAAIMERMKANHVDLSAKEAAEVVKNSIKKKDESIKAANEEYNERLKIAAQLRAEGGAENEKLADKVVEEATRQKDESINKAKEMHQGVVAEAQKQAENQASKVDWTTGEIKSKWQV
ncbi:hypothetical protein, partial [Clostridioides difficile]